MAVTATSLGTPAVDTAAPFTNDTSGTVPSGGLVVCVAGFVKTTATPVVLTVSGGSLTWQQDNAIVAPVSASGFEVQLHVFSAPAPTGLASGTTVTVAAAGGTPDFGIFISLLYLTGTRLDSSRVDITGGLVRDVGVPTATWAVPSTATTNPHDGIVGAAWSDDTATNSTPGGGYAEINEAHNGPLDWQLVTQFLETTVTGAQSATGTWNATPQADACAMVAYKALPDDAGVAWIKA